MIKISLDLSIFNYILKLCIMILWNSDLKFLTLNILIEGFSNVLNAIKIAQLALKHRMNKA
jgi:hypothetical protein